MIQLLVRSKFLQPGLNPRSRAKFLTLFLLADQLLGVERVKADGRVRDSRLWRRFSLIEKLPPSRRKPIVQLLDTFIEREQLRRKMEEAGT